MTNRIFLKRGSSTDNDVYVGAPGEVTYDSTNDTVRVFSGSKTGGTLLLNPSSTANNTNFVGNIDSANVVSNAQLQANLSLYSNSILMLANVATAYTNAITYATTRSYVNTSQLSSNLSNYQTSAGLSANVALLSSNNALYLGGVAANNYLNVSNNFTVNGIITLSKNLVFTNTSTIVANSSKGTSGQILTSNANTIYWATPAPPAFVFIRTQTVNTSTNVVSFSNLSGYDKYKLIYNNVVYGPLKVTVSNTSSEVTSSYQFAAYFYGPQGVTTASSTGSGQIPLDTSSLSVSNPLYFSFGELLFQNFTSVLPLAMSGQTNFPYSTGPNYQTTAIISGFNGTVTGPFTAINIYTTQTVYTSGTFSLYGLTS
jgi:hypothetical protein